MEKINRDVGIITNACQRVQEHICPVFENQFFETNLPRALNGVTKVNETLKSLEGRVVLSRANALIALVIVNVVAPLGFIWLLVDASTIYKECGIFPAAPVAIYGVNLLALIIFNVFQTQNVNNSVAFSKVEKTIEPNDLSKAFNAVSHTIKRIASDQRKIAKLKERIVRYKELCSKHLSTDQGSPSISSDTTSSATTTSSSDADDEEEENDDLESGLLLSKFRAKINYGEVQYVLISREDE